MQTQDSTNSPIKVLPLSKQISTSSSGTKAPLSISPSKKALGTTGTNSNNSSPLKSSKGQTSKN